jgi:hypothetical protein
MVQVQKQTHRPMERIEDPEISSHTYSHLILDQGAKNISGKKMVTSTNGIGKTEHSHTED